MMTPDEIIVTPESRVIYVNEYNNGLGMCYLTRDEADINAYPERARCIKFIEVIEEVKE